VDQTVHVGRALTYDISGLITDPDAGERATLTYSVVENGQGDLPDWLSFDHTTQIFSGTPLIHSGPHTIEIQATDSHSLSSTLTSFLITLTVNNPPVYTPLADQLFM